MLLEWPEMESDEWLFGLDWEWICSGIGKCRGSGGRRST